jgi:hypothetical protein
MCAAVAGPLKPVAVTEYVTVVPVEVVTAVKVAVPVAAVVTGVGARRGRSGSQ